MFNPGQMQRNYQHTAPIMRNSTNLILDNIHNNNRSKWDEPIQIPPILYSKFSIPMPSFPKQSKSYPNSLLGYIKRSYEKCKDDNQKNAMEKILREVVKNFQNDFNQVNWQSYPLPNLQSQASQIKSSILKSQQRQSNHITYSKLNQIKLLSCYKIVQQQKPSKAMQIAKKRSEKLEQKLNRTNKQGEEEKQKQVFIGFSSVPPIQIKQPPRLHFPPPLSTSLLTKTSQNNEQNKTLLKSQKNNEATALKDQKPPIILKCQNTQKSDKKIQKQKQKKQKQKIKQQKMREKQRQKQQKQKQKQRQKQKQKQKLNEKIKEEKPVGKISKIKLDEKPKQSTNKITKKELQLISKLKQNDESVNQVARRYSDFNKLKSDNYQKDAIEIDDQVDFEQVIVGKSQSIEKPYLRITGRPNPDTVRPEPILRKAFEHFVGKYNRDNNYEYLISELRSIRQDLTVQHIKNGFTIQVYEYNLEISLYQKDIPQFKHCQTTLWQLYCQGHVYTQQSRNKFVAHQMTTLIMEDKSQQLEYMLTKIPANALDTPQIQQCLKLKKKLIVGNYRAFFDFYNQQNKFIKHLLDLYIDKMYVKFMLMICKTCGQKVLIKSLAQMLGQTQSKIQSIIKAEGGVIQNGMLILKPSYDIFLKSQHLVTKKVTVLLG